MSTHAHAPASPARTPLLPVWLWFWVGVYLLTLPGLISYLATLAQDVVAQYYTWSVQVGGETSFFEMLRATNLYELAAYGLVLVGVLLTLLPHVRCFYEEHKHKLVEAPRNPAVQEITAFVRQYVPHIQVRANTTRNAENYIITYPRGFRKPALGVFRNFFHLWRSDRKAAEAILLHEIAHVRQGDTLMLGAGSFFEQAVGGWVVVFLLFVCLPLTLYTGGSIIEASNQLNQLGIFSLGRYLSRIAQILASSALSLIGEFMLTFSIVLMPLAGIWTSELLADYIAAKEVDSDEMMRHAIQRLSAPKSWVGQIIAGATHPPMALRKLLIEHINDRWAMILLISIFPLMFVVRLLVRLGSLLPNMLEGAENFGGYVQIAIHSWASSSFPYFVAMAVWLLLWWWAEPLWDRFFTRSAGVQHRPPFGPLAIGALVSVGIALLAGVASALTSPAAPISITPTSPPSSTYKIGQVFQVGDAQVVVTGWETLTSLTEAQQSRIGLEANLAHSVDTLTGSPDEQVASDKKIIRVSIAVRNNGSDTIAPLVSCAQLQDDAGRNYHYSYDQNKNSVITSLDLPSGAPKPGERLQGKISFLVDRDANNISFIYIANPPVDMSSATVPLTDDPAGAVSPPETLPASSNTADTTPEGQPLSLDGLTVTVDKVWPIENKLFTPDAGKRFVALNLTLNNTSDKTFQIANIFMFELVDDNGITITPGAIATGATGKQIPSQDLDPGQHVSISLGFEVPDTLKQAKLQYMLDSKQSVKVALP